MRDTDLRDTDKYEQFSMNIEKERIDKKVHQMEHEGEKRKQVFHDNKKIQERIRIRAEQMLRGIPKK